MNDILYRAAAYLLIIALGVFLKKVGFFHEQDFRTLAKILLNITLPCAIIYSFSKVDYPTKGASLRHNSEIVKYRHAEIQRYP